MVGAVILGHPRNRVAAQQLYQFARPAALATGEAFPADAIGMNGE
jgi:hypothetical protein